MNPLLKKVTSSANKLYQPQIDIYKKQLKGLGGAFAPKKTALEQAKVNAFRDFDAQANDRGLFYSGAPIQKRAQYIGETYTPGLAEIGTAEASQRLNLLQALNKLLGERGEAILGRYDTLQANAVTNALARKKLAQERRMSEREINALLERARI